LDAATPAAYRQRRTEAERDVGSARLGASTQDGEAIMRNGTIPAARDGSGAQINARIEDEYLVDVAHAHDEVRFAMRAVTVHTAEAWPAGMYCRNDHAAFPCRLYQWGRRVLIAAGWSDEAIAELEGSDPRPFLCVEPR
jgi:hypothetical protein